MKRYILMFFVLMIGLFFLNVNVVYATGSDDDTVEEAPSKEESDDDGYQATVACPYVLEYPEAYIAANHPSLLRYSTDEIRKMCNEKRSTQYPDPEDCINEYLNNKVLTTVYVEAVSQSDPKMYYVGSKQLKPGTDKGDTKPATNMDGQEGTYEYKRLSSEKNINDYLNSSKFNNAPIYLKYNLEKWDTDFKGNHCPNLHLHYDLANQKVIISDRDLTSEGYKYHREIVSGDIIDYDPEEGDIPDTPKDPDELETTWFGACENFRFVGAGNLAGKAIDLKMKIDMYRVSGSGRIIYDLTFSSGEKSKTFKNVRNDNLEYYPINFNISGIGSNVNLLVSEDSKDGLVIENFIHPATCASGQDVFIYPYDYTDINGNKIRVYKIAAKVREYEIDVGKGNSPELQKINYGKVTCATLFGSEGSRNSTHGLLKVAIRFIQYLGVILASVLSVLDFIKVVPTQDKDAIKKSTTKAVTRLGIAIAIFLVPVLLKFILELIGISNPLCGLI